MGTTHPNQPPTTDEYFVIDTVRGDIHSTADEFAEAFEQASDAGPTYVVAQFVEPPEGAE